MKILFITTNDIKQAFGGALASKRNYEMLCSLAGKESVEMILLSELENTNIFCKVKKFFSKVVYRRQFDLTPLFNLEFTKYDVLFNDNSVTGEIFKIAANNGYKGKKISFFHNCELSLYQQMYSGVPWYKRIPLIRIVKANETLSLKLSDKCILLNQRDLKSLKDLYSIDFKNIIIPITLEDRFDKSKMNISIEHQKPVFTFLGSYFAPNVNGILWFIKNVLPFVDIKLQIIGKNMSKIFDKIDNKKGIEILSDVTCLDKYLYESDCMLFPIFEGSGMKLKTCEALMFGKNIIGTPEAFAGYDIDDYTNVGACCRTPDDFINSIKFFNKPRFNEYSRNFYLKNYSYEVSKDLFVQLFKTI